MDRLTALRLFTLGSAWFSGEETTKGDIAPGMVADFAILDRNILKVDERDLLNTKSDLTVVNGEIQYASEAYPYYRIPVLPAIPDWSPVNSGSRQ